MNERCETLTTGASGFSGLANQHRGSARLSHLAYGDDSFRARPKHLLIPASKVVLATADTASMVSVLDFINRVRTLQDLGEWGALPLLRTEADDEHHDVVASALGVSVGESEHHDWAAQGRWVMRFADRLTARRIGIVTGLEWRGDPPEVQLPDALVDLAVSQHLDIVVRDDVGFVRGWWVPGDDDGMPVFLAVTDPLIPANGGVFRPAG